MKSFFYRLFRWEFWPVKVVYFPIFIYVLHLGLRFRNFLFFTCVNPYMEVGGLFNASKYKQLKHLPDTLKPKTVLLTYPYQNQDLNALIQQFALAFPMIVKPDKAERGKGIKLLRNQKELEVYCEKANYDIVLQAYIDYPFEAGVLFYRFPGENSGHISSIVIKSFLAVTGDGQHTVEQLLIKDPRNHIYLEKTQVNNAEILSYTPKQGEEYMIEPIGNHNRGTMFLNGNSLITKALEDIFTEISNHLPDFYYGRFDLRSTSQEDFLKGQNIKIVEVNGVNSEPAHIYEPGTTLIFGLKTILWHWKTIYKLAKANQKNGIQPVSFTTFRDLWKNRKL